MFHLKGRHSQYLGFSPISPFSKASPACSTSSFFPRREVPKSLLKSRLELWQSPGGIIKLWEEIICLPAPPPATSSSPSVSTTRTLHWARLGRLGNAIKALSSSGVANPEDSSVQAEILMRHPEGPVLEDSDLPITWFSRPLRLSLRILYSPSGFQLRAQHLLAFGCSVWFYGYNGSRLLT